MNALFTLPSRFGARLRSNMAVVIAVSLIFLWIGSTALSTAAAQSLAARTEMLTELNGQITSGVHSGEVAGPKVRAALAARHELLENIIRNDAASARSYMLDKSVRAALIAADASAQQQIEEDGAITGELVSSVADDFAHGTASTHYSLHTIDRDLDLSFVQVIPGIDRMTHRQVTIYGLRLTDIIAVDSLARATPEEIAQCQPLISAPTTQNSAVPATCSTTGVQSIAVLLVTFPGNSPSFPAGMDQPAYWNQILTGPNPSVNSYWEEVSYGQTSATSSVFGPFPLSELYDCNSTSAMATAAIAAAASTVDLTQYNRIVIAYPASSCWFGGLANIGCVSATSTINHQYSVVWLPISSWYKPDDITPQMWGDAAHELGHNLGLGHANTLDFGSFTLGPLDFVASNPGTVHPSPPALEDSGTIASSPVTAVNTEYGDSFSVMGNGWNNGGPYSAEHKLDLLGWIPKTDEREVTAASTFTIVPAESSSGLRALRVLRDPVSSSWLWIEFHQPIGYYTPNNMSALNGNTLTNGALIHYEAGSLDPLHTYILDMTPATTPNNFNDGTLAPGSSWSDPYSLLTLTAGTQTGSSLDITVSYDTPCASLSLSASELAYAGGTANLNITAPNSCSWSVSSNAPWISFPGTTSGNGNATIPFAYTANTTSAQRSSYITAQRQSLPIVQDGPDVTVVGVSPAMSKGSSQSFVVSISDALGSSDLSGAYFRVEKDTSLSGCEVYVFLQGPTNASEFYVLAPGSVWTGILPGSSQSVSSSACTLYGQGSSVVYSGNNVSITFNLSFPTTYSGTYPLSVQAYSSANKTLPPVTYGIFTVTTDSSAATPVISPAGGTFTAAQSVTISDATPGAIIYYTTDNSGPTTASPQYSSPIAVSQTETIRAIAVAPGFSQSAVAAVTFTINLPAVATPVISPSGGTFTSIQTVTITDSTSGATIYYTTDGSQPTSTSTIYTGPITISQNQTIKAFATASGYSQSAVATAVFTIAAATPVISPSGGTFASPQTVTITDSTSGAIIYYTTDGSQPTSTSTIYTGPITISQNQTIKAVATASGYSQSAVATAAFTIAAATPVISPSGGTFTSIQTVTITDSTSGATIYYTTDGSTPTVSSMQYTGAITVSQSQTIKAIATATGYAQSSVASAAFTINLPVTATPVISPNGGTFTSTQSVTITDPTSGAEIYYTTDGTQPTRTSSRYTGPITVAQSETIEAIAIASGYSQSTVATAVFTIITATPVISPAGGTFSSPQSVTITDSTLGATIYYTTDGSTPTVSATRYMGSFTVSQSLTVKAVAVGNGFPVSAVGSAAFIITNPSPVIESISPPFASLGSSAFTLTVNGTGFTASSTVYWGTTSLATTFTSATKLSAQVPASSITTAGTFAITVQNPAPGGGTSNSLLFEVDSASSGTTPPSFTTVTATVTRGSSATYSVTLPSSATNITVTCLNLPSGAQCTYASGVLTISTSPTTPMGTYQITVVFTETIPGTASALVLFPLFTLTLVIARRRWAAKGIWFVACLGAVFVVAAAVTGCGGGSGGGGSTTPPPSSTHQITSSGAVTLTIS